VDRDIRVGVTGAQCRKLGSICADRNDTPAATDCGAQDTLACGTGNAEDHDGCTDCPIRGIFPPITGTVAVLRARPFAPRLVLPDLMAVLGHLPRSFCHGANDTGDEPS
jgi:hypothetical protein